MVWWAYITGVLVYTDGVFGFLYNIEGIFVCVWVAFLA